MYEEFYQLKAKPFRLSPDPEFFFASRGHKRALAYLRYGLSQDEGFVVITGAPGTGKTTLPQILLKEMNQSKVVVANITTTQLDADETLRMVAASLGLPFVGQDKPTLLKTMEEFLLLQSRENKRVLLVVDEAQNLPSRSIEELRMLSNLQVGNKALLQTFLLGQTQFRNMLEHPDHEQFRQRVIANYHLSELAEDECQHYIESRLQHVGWKDDPHFTHAAYKGIYQYTHGIPRRINMLCDRLMLFGFLEARHEIDQKVLREVTKELQQEISGHKIGTGDQSFGQDSMYSELHKQYKDNNKPDWNAFKEFGSQNKRFNENMDQDGAEERTENFGLNESSLDRVMPDEFFEKLVKQGLIDEYGNDNVSKGSKLGTSRANSHHTNKDRFHVISGGRRNQHAGIDDMQDDISMPESDSPDDVSASSKEKSKDSNEIVLRKILRLVLAYHRSPRSFPGLDDPTQPLPKGINQILNLAVSSDDVLKDLRQISVMGISPAMLRAAVRFFVRRVMFIPGGDDYRVLGLTSSATQEELEEHYGLLMQIMRQEKQGHQDSGIARIKEAYERLIEGEAPEIEGEASNQQNEADNINEIGDEFDLDIDLSPNGDGVSSREISRERGVDQLSDLIAGDQLSDMISGDRRTAQASRYVVLITGAVVVGFVLYLTQITSPDLGDKTINPTVSEQEIVSGQQDVEKEGMGFSTEETTIDGKDIEQGFNNPGANSETRDDTENEELRRQRILDELRAQAQAEEKARKEADEIEREKRDAEIRRATLAAQKAQEAQAAAEVKARREAEERARAKAAAKARREAEERARAEAAAKARREAEERARVEAAAKARREAEERARVEAATLAEKQTQAQNASAPTVIATGPEILKAEPLATIEELKQVLEKFAVAYRSGEIQQFMGVFTPDAKTNDRSTLQGIRDDYFGLFANTEYRNIEFIGMQWQREGGISRGEGNYVVKVRPNGNSENEVYRGRLWFTIKRHEGRLLISYFAFE